MVRIAAFQAVNLGLIPDQNAFFYFKITSQILAQYRPGERSWKVTLQSADGIFKSLTLFCIKLTCDHLLKHILYNSSISFETTYCITCGMNNTINQMELCQQNSTNSKLNSHACLVSLVWQSQFWFLSYKMVNITSKTNHTNQIIFRIADVYIYRKNMMFM